jgi:arylsulfatase
MSTPFERGPLPGVIALAAPAAAVAAVVAWQGARGFADENLWPESGYDHLAAVYTGAVVLRAVGLAAAGGLVGAALVAVGGLVPWLRGRHGVALLAAGLVAAWLVLLLDSPRSWSVARVRGDFAVPNLLWRVLPREGELPPGALETWIACAACVAVGLVLALAVGSLARRRGWSWPGAAWTLVGYGSLAVALLASAAAWAGPRWLAPPSAAPATEAVLFLTWDSTRADHLSCYGYERETTPNVDAFAADSMLYERAYANHNWTRPSYMTMLTGRPGWEVDIKRLRYSKTTLAEALRDAGYATRAFVQNPNLDFSFRMDQGFDRYLQFTEDARPAEIARWAVSAIEELAGRPFFLFVHVEQPHWPYHEGGEFVAHVDPDDPPVTKYEIEQLLAFHELEHFDPDAPDAAERLQYLRDAYDSDIRDADSGLGTILDALRRHGLYDDALVVFNSDHGEEFFDRGNFGHAHRNVYQELTRIPLVVHYPSSLGVAPGRSDALVQNLDLYPTIVDVLALPRVPGLTGTSLREVEERRAGEERAVISAFNGLVAVRTRDHALIHDVKRGLDPILYDIADDPDEGEPVADPTTVEAFEMLRSLADWWATDCWADGDDVPGRTDEMTPELMQRLKDLGYLGND